MERREDSRAMEMLIVLSMFAGSNIVGSERRWRLSRPRRTEEVQVLVGRSEALTLSCAVNSHQAGEPLNSPFRTYKAVLDLSEYHFHVLVRI